jgi:RNA polymerase sigma-70 factor (ECF subfamily)
MNREDAWATKMRAANRGCAESYLRVLHDIADALRLIAARELARRNVTPADAEDIVQEVLIAIHTKRHTWDESRPILPWVYAVMRYKMIDYLRRRRPMQEVPLSDELCETLEGGTEVRPAPARELERNLDNLPVRQREVVQMVAVEGASVGEVADRLHVSQGAVRVALHRGLSTIAAISEKEN